MCGGMRCARACHRSRRACVRRLRGNGVERCAKLTLDIESTIKHRVIMLAGGMGCTHESRPKSATAPSSLNNSRDRTQLLQRSRRACRGEARGAAGGGAQFLTISEFLFAEISLCDETPIPTTGRMSSAVAPAPASNRTHSRLARAVSRFPSTSSMLAPASNRTHSRLARAVSRFPSTSSISQRVGSLSSVRRATS